MMFKEAVPRGGECICPAEPVDYGRAWTKTWPADDPWRCSRCGGTMRADQATACASVGDSEWQAKFPNRERP